jgi:hypothetical protein
MTQAKTFTWTNPNPAIARNLDVGFDVSEVTIVDKTNGGSWYWNDGMADASVLDVDAGTITGTNGVTPLSQSAMFGAAITGFTNANPGVITASNLSAFGFEAGDTIQTAAIADDGSGTSLNGQFTVASVSATAITLVENTSAPTYSVYVSGGFVTRVEDSDGNPVATNNVAIQGVTLGTSAVGANSAAMTAIVRGNMNVT